MELSRTVEIVYRGAVLGGINSLRHRRETSSSIRVGTPDQTVDDLERCMTEPDWMGQTARGRCDGELHSDGLLNVQVLGSRSAIDQVVVLGMEQVAYWGVGGPVWIRPAVQMGVVGRWLCVRLAFRDESNVEDAVGGGDEERGSSDEVGWEGCRGVGRYLMG